MSQHLEPGDFLVFQLVFALLRLLAVDESDGERTWHLAAYSDLFPDVDSAEALTADASRLTVSHPHLALTDRAFESTQVAKIGNVPLTPDETGKLDEWRNRGEMFVSDRSVRLMLGLR